MVRATNSMTLIRSSILLRAISGQRVLLYGPRGSGKSTLLEQLRVELVRQAVPCGYAPSTAHLDDITRALTTAYPAVKAAAVRRRTARARLRLAADRRGGVLLLDHVSEVSNAMVGFMRRMVGGMTGIVLAFDVESDTERAAAIRPGRLGGLPIRMPETSARQLKVLWRRLCRHNTGSICRRRSKRDCCGKPPDAPAGWFNAQPWPRIAVTGATVSWS